MSSLLLIIWAPLLAADTVESPKAPPTATDRRDIREVIPGDCWAAIIIHDLEALDGELQAILPKRRSTGTGIVRSVLGRLSMLPKSSSTSARIVPFVRGWLSMPDGFDARGSSAVLVMPHDQSEPIGQHFMLILPFGDYQAITTLWNPQPVEPGYHKIVLAGQESFMAALDGYCLIAPRLAIVKSAVHASDHLADELASVVFKASESPDVEVSINVSALTEGPVNQRYGPWLDRMFGLDAEAIKSYRRVHAMAKLGTDALDVRLTVQASSSVAATERQALGTPLLLGLPDDNPTWVVGMNTSDAGFQIASPEKFIPAFLSGIGILDASRLKMLSQYYAKALPLIESVAASVSMLPVGSDGMLAGVKVIKAHGAARDVVNAIREGLEGLKGGAFLNADLNLLLQKLVYREAVETIAGVAVDHLMADFGGEEPELYTKLKSVLGSEGLLIRVGIVDGKYVVITFGGGLERFATVGDLVRSGRAPISSNPQIIESAQGLPFRGPLEAHFFPNRFNELFNMVAGGLENPYRRANLPPSTPPIGVFMLTASRSEVQFHIRVPTDLLALTVSSMTSEDRTND